MRHKRRRLGSVPCPTQQLRIDHSLDKSGRKDPGALLENPTPDVAQSFPDSTSSSLDGTADSLLSILAVSKKENGSRMYSKKQYCFYCKLGVVKMARHLERAHKHEPEVAQALRFPKGFKEGRMHLEYLRNGKLCARC